MLSQLFLPYSNFRRSVTCYSDALLVESLKTIRKSREVVRAHDACVLTDAEYVIRRAWRGHYQALSRLAVFCYEEAVARGLNVSLTRLTTAKEEVKGAWVKPHWVGWERCHSRHRANLLAIGAGENLALRICVWKSWPLDIRGEEVRQFFESFFRSLQWYDSGAEAVHRLHSYLDAQGAPNYYGNHYNQFDWLEEPDSDRLGLLCSEEYVAC